jgi:hypothetical protein
MTRSELPSTQCYPADSRWPIAVVHSAPAVRRIVAKSFLLYFKPHGDVIGLAPCDRAATQQKSTAIGLDFLIDVIGVCGRPSILLNSYPDATDHLEVRLQSLSRALTTAVRFATAQAAPSLIGVPSLLRNATQIKLTFKNFLNLSGYIIFAALDAER